METTVDLEKIQQRKIEHIKWKVERTFFDVRKEANPEGKFNLVDENGRVLSRVSDRYTIVKNRDIIQPIIDKFGWENVVRADMTGRGTFLYEVKTGRSIDIDGNGDLVEEKLVAGNSYNKSKAYWYALGAFRGYCSNGLLLGVAFFNYKKIHVGEIPIQSLVQNVLNTYTNNDFNLWKRMAQVPLSDSEMIVAADEFKAFEVKKEHPLDLSPNEELNKSIVSNARYYLNQNGNAFPRTVWGLYNAMNSSIAQVFRWKRSQQSKLILANKNAESYLAQRYELN